MQGIVGVDLGSGGCKVVIINEEGGFCAKAYREWPTHYPHPGWSEQWPEEWELGLRETLQQAMDSVHMKPAEVAVLAFSSATHSTVFLDKKNRVLRPAILWTDRRTIPIVERLKRDHEDLIFSETLHAPNVNWSLPYLIWVRENEPSVWEKVSRILMPKDYIRLRLTGEWATDPIDAVGTLMFNPVKKEWSARVCSALQIPMHILPPVLPPSQVAGGLTQEGADLLGLKEGIPVIVGTTDQAAEALCAGAIQPGQGILKMATAGNVAIVTRQPHPVPLQVYAYLHLVPGLWYSLTGTISCAVCYRWLRDTFFKGAAVGTNPGSSLYEQMDASASQVPIGSEGLIFHPYLQGSFTNPYLKADFVGVTFRHHASHFCRAVLEGVAFSLFEGLKREEALGISADNFRLIGGGAKSPLWRRIICDVFGREILIPSMDDSSFGMAMLGGVAQGVFADLQDAVNRCVHYRESISPDMASHKIYQEIYEGYQETAEALKASYERMGKIRISV